MSMVAHTHPFVIGVDAHARNHALAILACPTGEVLDEGQFPASGAGLQRAVDWVARRTGGDLDTLWVVEGVGTYGARLARAAADAGYSVAEAARMNARANRGVGKSDPLDACRIAQAVLPLDVNLIIEKVRRLAHGFKDFDHYRLRIMLAADGRDRTELARTMLNSEDPDSWTAVANLLRSGLTHRATY
jgi:hypothetical protein